MFHRLHPVVKIGSSNLKLFSPSSNVLRIASNSSTPAVVSIPDNFPKKVEGPERDLVNFPRPKQAEFGGKVRLGFVPEEWFQFFYNKTGVTGPYMLGIGLSTFLLSKEIFVVEHEFWNGVSLAIMITFAVKKFGPQAAAYLDKEGDDELKILTESRDLSIQNYKEGIEDEKTEQWRAEGQTLLFEAKKENVGLQLEANYRKNLMSVYSEVKKRLDYQVMIITAKRQAEHNHLANWVYDQVLKGITPQQEADTLKQCIVDLKTLAAKA